MGKRKVFIKTNLDTPGVEHVRDAAGTVVIPADAIPPEITVVKYGPSIGAGTRAFDFAPWYGVGIDAVTYACQRQIERFLDKQDLELSPLTVRTYCVNGLSGFLRYLTMLSTALRRDLTLNDINRETIDSYLGFLKDSGVAKVTQSRRYSSTKAVLGALCQRGLIHEILAGDSATFPFNPFPGVTRNSKGEQPLPKEQRKAFARAVKTAVMPIFSDDVEHTSELLAFALLIIALHTGRNTWPLLEMSPDCLRPHPKDDVLFLVLYKRRGHSTSKAAIRADFDRPQIESMATVRPTVARLIRRVLDLSSRLRHEAPAHLRDRVWLYRMQTPGRGVGAVGDVTALNPGTLERAVKTLVKRYELVDTDGKPLRVSVSRLRKTFVNRIYEILDGDVVATASAAGDTVKVTSTSYLRPGEDAKKNWKFLGATLVQELLTNTIGATERTPMGRCSDSKNGEYAPKRNGATCMSFINCLRCRNYVVTGDDLYRLFSFYWRVLKEQARMEPKRWRRQFAHVVRLIDRDVIDAGLAKGVFKKAIVSVERERARVAPHPFWRCDTILGDIAEGLI
ncbi:hypothetical protein [Burkholderia sp. Ac-20392]|uniref:hypothetical protein n=1 Tax=Burkholderia sp. Ac-20392 TaxID=2703905 RepID=UPI00198241F6|nr:hypothetical protein [Burkholderia sp. Ac-20392]MBN3799408.1 hypothetical protein [Burkholderia sp. Ac-20392]